MNSNQLRHFKIIADCGNITKASELLYITQPALSTSLSKLEKELSTTLFLRDGRMLTLTEDGRILYHYAQIVTDAIDRAQEHFHVREDSQTINLYRIGGIAANLLTENCFHMEDYRLNYTLVHNRELPQIAASELADLIIADERYMNKISHKYNEKLLLYHQSLILSVRKEDTLARFDELHVRDLQKTPLLGHINPLGFEAWISEIKKENQCDFHYELALDNMTYFAEREHIPWPVFISSFGIGIHRGKDYFSKRKSIRMKGSYTERDIYLWYNKQNKKHLEPMLRKIKSNAEHILALDEASGYL